MGAEIKGFFSADASDLERWRPATPEDLYLGLELSIGEAGRDAADLFQIVIASPQAIAGRPDRRRPKLLIVNEWNWSVVKATLQSWVAECSQDSWDRTLTQLREKLDWEFGGMGPHV